MKRALLIAAACATLAGCITPAQIAARDDAVCQSYGAAVGTPAYTDCRLRRDQQRQAFAINYMNQMNENARRQQESFALAAQPIAAPRASSTTNCIRTSDITVSCTTN
jgi:hypothetical protein